MRKMSRPSRVSAGISQFINNEFNFLEKLEDIEDQHDMVILKEQDDQNQNDGKRHSSQQSGSTLQTVCRACDIKSSGARDNSLPSHDSGYGDSIKENKRSNIELNVRVSDPSAVDFTNARSSTAESSRHSDPVKTSDCDSSSISNSGVVLRKKSAKKTMPDAGSGGSAVTDRVNTTSTAQSFKQLNSTDGRCHEESRGSKQSKSVDHLHSVDVGTCINHSTYEMSDTVRRCSLCKATHEKTQINCPNCGLITDAVPPVGSFGPPHNADERITDRERLSDSPKPSEDSDDDNDAGVYSDSYRNSKWIYKGEDGNTSFCPLDIDDIPNSDEFEEVEITEYLPIKPESGDELAETTNEKTLSPEFTSTDKTSAHANEGESEVKTTKQWADPAEGELTTDNRASTDSSGHPELNSPVTVKQNSDSVNSVVGDMGNGPGSLLRVPGSRKSALISDHELDGINEKENDEVFENSVNFRIHGHKRSESVSTTASELEFRKRYQAVSRKVIRRKSSLQAYQRKSQRFFDEGRTVIIKKEESSRGFGYHIHGCRPVMVSTVEPESPAEKSSLKTGDILLSVNDVNVSEADHNEVVSLMQKDKNQVKLEVIEGRLYSDMPLYTGYLTKQGGTGFLKSFRYRKRWFVLKRDHCMYYYKTPQDKDPLGAISLTNYTISKAPELNKNYAFKAYKYGHRTYYFIAESEEEMSRWAGFMREAAEPTSQGDIWLDISSHNVGLPALCIKKPDCHGYLTKIGNKRRTMSKRRYCVLKDACMYYYIEATADTAQGVAHLHGYTVEPSIPFNKKLGFTLTPPEEKLRVFYFCADNETDLNRWILALQTSIGRWVKSD